jgi:hypothetical protein
MFENNLGSYSRFFPDFTQLLRIGEIYPVHDTEYFTDDASTNE